MLQKKQKQKTKHKCKTDRNDGDNPGFRKRIQYIETLRGTQTEIKMVLKKKQYLQVESSKESLTRRINQVENRRSELKDKIEDFHKKTFKKKYTRNMKHYFLKVKLTNYKNRWGRRIPGQLHRPDLHPNHWRKRSQTRKGILIPERPLLNIKQKWGV